MLAKDPGTKIIGQKALGQIVSVKTYARPSFLKNSVRVRIMYNFILIKLNYLAHLPGFIISLKVIHFLSMPVHVHIVYEFVMESVINKW